MAKVITDKLHSDLTSIIESLMDKAKDEQKARLAGMFSQLKNADTPPGYED